MKFRTLVVDPPWPYRDRLSFPSYRPTPAGAGVAYSLMTLDDLAALPIQDVAEDDAHLYLWVTNGFLPQAGHLLSAWGFRYITALTWDKGGMGMGFYFRNNTEHVLFGVRGKLFLKRRDLINVIRAPRGGRHSEKPQAFYDLVEEASPGPYLDIFGRTITRLGWTGIGNEVGIGGDVRDRLRELAA